MSPKAPSLYYKLLGKLAVPCKDAREWAQTYGASDRHVMQSHVGGIFVSTVFLGLDHNFGSEGPPLIFETMIFRGQEATECWRSSSWDEAEKQHEEAMALVRAEIKDKVNE